MEAPVLPDRRLNPTRGICTLHLEFIDRHLASSPCLRKCSCPRIQMKLTLRRGAKPHIPYAC
jgi:hypothetical protein